MNNIPNNLEIDQEEGIDLRALLFKYIKNWYWFVFSVFLICTVVFFYLKRINPSYEIKTSILIRTDNAGAASQRAVLEGLGVREVSKETEDEMQILQSRTIMTRVIEALDLETEYYLKTKFTYKECYKDSPIKLLLPENYKTAIKQSFVIQIKRTKKGYDIDFETSDFFERYTLTHLPGSIKTPFGVIGFAEIKPIEEGAHYKTVTTPMRVLTERYCSQVKISPANKKSNTIIISTNSATPKKAEDVLNKLVELYNKDAVDEKNQIGTHTAKFIEERVDMLEKELDIIELDLENYKKSNKLTNVATEAELFLKSANEYEKKLSEIETQINLVSFIEDYVKSEDNKYNLIPSNLGIEDMSLIALVQEYNKNLMQRVRLLRTSNVDNPVISQMEVTLFTLRSNIISSINSIKSGLEISKKGFDTKGDQYIRKIKALPGREREFIEKKRLQEIKQSLYLYLLQKQQETDLDLATTVPSAKTLDAAYTSTSPVAPKKKMIFLIAFFFSILVPAGIIYLRDLWNDTILDKKEYLSLVKAPFLGTIGVSKSNDPVVVKAGAITPLMEMFRLIRTNLQFMLDKEKKSHVILVTSSLSGEGKSFVSINLALSFAIMNKKVAIIGLDIRNPMLDKYLKVSKNPFGATMYLADKDIKLDEIIQKYPGNENLSIILSGATPPNPTELLMSRRLDELVAKLKENYDYIIIDSAPVGLVSDTYQLSRVADNTIYISREGYTPKEISSLINEIYEEKKLTNLSVVLNGTEQDSGGYYYGKGYGKKYYVNEKKSRFSRFRKFTKG